jgi:predicted protein tyrosine phosphatase
LKKYPLFFSFLLHPMHRLSPWFIYFLLAHPLLSGVLATTTSTPFLPTRVLEECHRERSEDVDSGRFGNVPFYNPADQITPMLWVGSVCAATNRTFLEENGIALVISMASEWPFTGNFDGIAFKSVPLHDSIYEDENETLDALRLTASIIESYTSNPTPPGVLVYCNMGISRSVTAIIYTMIYLDNSDSERSARLPFATYLEVVRAKRPIARPNQLYQRILTAFADNNDRGRKEEL